MDKFERKLREDEEYKNTIKLKSQEFNISKNKYYLYKVRNKNYILFFGKKLSEDFYNKLNEKFGSFYLICLNSN